MKRLAILFLMLHTMTVFAFANNGTSFKSLSPEVVTVEKVEASHLVVSDDLVSDDGDLKKVCKCKEHSKATTFLCGLTLAPVFSSYDYFMPQIEKERFAIHQADRVKSLIGTLKRPPRTTL